MNRVEFLAELERLLSGMPEEERQAAVQYYADYLADAGVENEGDAIRELGSPEKAAESIRADYYGTEFDESKFDHKDYMEKYGLPESASGAEGSQWRKQRGSRCGSRTWSNGCSCTGNTEEGCPMDEQGT